MNADYIDPVVLAARMEDETFLNNAVKATGQGLPRVRELLWFLQSQSLKADGLKRLMAPIVAHYTPEYEKVGKADGWYLADNPEHLSVAVKLLCNPFADGDYMSHHEHPGGAFDLLSNGKWRKLWDSLFALMNQHAADTLKTIVQTEVARTIFRELEFSLRKNVPVPIIGESRIGKTKPATVWCAARPGRARLVDVPESNRDRDFVIAHADAFGIEYTSRTTTQRLRADVQFVNQRAGLFIIYDEAQFLVPVNYNKSTAPHRLNWVRRQVVDRERGCGLIATPQSYHQTLDQYVKTTGYKMEQWLGRMAPPVILPADLGREDLLAVAKLNFPDMPMPFLKLIAARAMRSEGYLKNLEITAKRAAFLAEENGRNQVNAQDVQDAIAQMMPETVAEQPEAGHQAPAPRSDRPQCVALVKPARAHAQRTPGFTDRSLSDKLPLKGGIEAQLTPA